jgi:hypothetical protein
MWLLFWCGVGLGAAQYAKDALTLELLSAQRRLHIDE